MATSHPSTSRHGKTSYLLRHLDAGRGGCSLRRLRFPRLRPPHFSVVLLIVLATLLLARPAYALGEGVLFNALTSIINGIADLFFWATQVFGRFLTWVLTEFSQEVRFADNDMVQAGWVVVRDIANWFFIIFLLISALATILDIEALQAYSARRLVPRLIAAALLINFSLFFLGFVVNAAQVIMLLFVTGSGGEEPGGVGAYGDVGRALADGFRLDSLRAGTSNAAVQACQDAGNLTDDCIFTELAKAEKQETPEMQAAFAAARLLFSIGAAFVLLFLALLLIVRVVMIWFALILAPIAIIAGILPRTREYFARWLNFYLNWTLFGVIATFFIWLATWLIFYLRTAERDELFATTALMGPQVPILLQSAHLILQYLTVFVFLFMAVRVSKQMAGTAATILSGLITSVALGGFGAAARVAGVGVAGGRLAALRARLPARAGRLAQRVSTRLGPLGTPLARAGIAAETRQRAVDRERFNRARQRYELYSSSELERLAQQPNVLRGLHAAAVQDLLVERHRDISRAFTPDRQQANMNIARRFSSAQRMTRALPHLAMTGDALRNYMGTYNAAQFALLQASAFAHPGVEAGLFEAIRDRRVGATHLKALMASDNVAGIAAAREFIVRNYRSPVDGRPLATVRGEPVPAEFQRFLRTDPAARMFLA